MKDDRKTKKQLIGELKALRGKIASLERSSPGTSDEVADSYRRLAENLPGMVYRVYLEDGRMQFFNDMVQSMTGYPAEELLKGDVCSIDPLIIPEDRPAVLDTVRSAVQENRSFEVEYRIRHKKGDIRHFLEKGRPVYGTDGNPRYIDGIILDHTTHKRTEATLRESEAKYRTLFGSVPVGLVLTKFDGSILDTNDVMLRMLGYAREDLPRLRVQDAYENPEERELIVNQVRTHGFARDFEVRLRRKDGKRLYAGLTVKPFQMDGQDILLTVVSDFTRRKLAEEALKSLPSQLLESQEKERKKIAREIHDGIGQTLSAIKYRVEAALRALDRDKSPRTAEALTPIIDTVRDAVEEVRRISADLRPLSLSELGILATISWFCREFEATYPAIRIEKRISILEEHVPDSLKSVIYRILQEAMNNVARHSHASLLHLSLERTDNGIQLGVHDNGVGFDLDRAPKDAPSLRFGLTSMKERAELSGGAFFLDSAKGSGTSIRASWPC